MTGETIKEFLVGLGFDVDDKSLDDFNKGVANATKVAAGLATTAVAAGAAVFAFVDKVTSGLDEVDDLSKRVNGSAHEIQRLGHVATLTDSSVDAVASSLDRLNRIAGEAAMGQGEGVLIFDMIGVSATDAEGKAKATTDLIYEIGDAIKDLERGRQVAILEKLGIDPTLVAALTTDVSALREEFDAIYGSLGINADQAAKASSDFQDILARLRFMLDSVFDAVGIRLLPQLSRAMERLRIELMSRLPQIVENLEPVARAFGRVLEAIILIGVRGSDAMGKLQAKIKDGNVSLEAVVPLTLGAVAALKLLNLNLLTMPIGRLIALGALFLLAYEDMMVFRKGGQSLIDWGSHLGRSIKAAGMALVAVVGTYKLLIGLQAAWAALLATNPLVWVATLIALAAVVVSEWDTVRQWFVDFFDYLDAKFGGLPSTAIGAIGRLFGSAMDAASSVFGADTGVALAPAAALVNSPAITQNTEIHVSGQSDPDATAAAIGREQDRVAADTARNLQGGGALNQFEPQSVAFLPERSVGPFSAYVTIDEIGSDDLEITQHPVQRGAAITDHAFRKPARLYMRVIFDDSDAPLAETYEKFLALQRSAELFEVVTGKRLYRNMLATSVAQKTDSRTENILSLALELREVIIADLDVVRLPPRARQANPARTGATENAGKREAVAETSETRVEELRSILSTGTGISGVGGGGN